MNAAGGPEMLRHTVPADSAWQPPSMPWYRAACCCFCLKEQHSVNISLPPPSLSLGASFKTVEVPQPGSLGNSLEKCGEKSKIMSLPW